MKIFVSVGLMMMLMMGQVYATEKINAQPMIKVKSSPADLLAICTSVQVQCNQENIALWKLKNTSNDHYYLIDGTPQIVRLDKTGSHYRLLGHWNFKDYQHHNTTSDENMGLNSMSIYPTLYPVNRREVAIAILNSWFTGYSGGGASEKYADFVVLKPQGKYAVALKDIVFSSERMIRACFSEQEYNTSPHCHDEEWTVMSIRFKDIGKPYYQWQLHYSNYIWDAFKPKKSTRVEKHQYIVMPFQ